MIFADVSDVNGKVSIPTLIDSITFRYLGYQSLSMALSTLSGSRITMQAEGFVVDEITIVGRTGSIKEEIPFQIQTIDSEQLLLTNSQTSADALGANANVYVQKSQMGGGSPVLRGFEANKILLVVDGVRLNNAIYRSGHLQNAITIDQAMLDRMEVIFGAGSLNYGSDALGGVIHFKSRDPVLNFDPDKKANVEQGYYMRHSTANREKSIHYDLMYGAKKWGSISSITFSNFGDLTSGAKRKAQYPDFGKRFEYIERINGQDSILTNLDKNAQIGTAYKQLDIMQKFLIRPNDNLKLSFNAQFSTSTDVPRYDQLTERDANDQLRFAEWHYGPQKRILLSGKLERKSNTLFFDKVLAIASYQKIDEDRIERDYRSDIRTYQEEDVNVIGLTLDFFKNLNPRQNLKYGLDYQFNKVDSEGFEENIITKDRNFNVLSRYPSQGSDLRSFGFYGQYTWKSKSEKLISNSGVRYSLSQVNLVYDQNDPFPWPSSFIEGLTNNNSAWVASTGLNFNPSKTWQFHGLLASAFRAPNIDDLAKRRIKAGEISVPNVGLKPEKSISVELGFTQKSKRGGFVQGALFYTRLKDVIIREFIPLPNGETSIIDGIDTLLTVGNINADKAYVYGFNLNTQVNLTDRFKWNAAINYTYGRAIDEDGERPLAHIPPVFGRTGIDWSYEKFELSGIVRFNAKKDIADFGDSTDNPEQATSDGSPSWVSYNLYLSYPYFDSLRLRIGVENIMNVHYRPFSSGVSAPARNLIISLGGRF